MKFDASLMNAVEGRFDIPENFVEFSGNARGQGWSVEIKKIFSNFLRLIGGFSESI